MNKYLGFVKKRDISVWDMLFGMCLLFSFMLAVYSIMTVGRSTINSDTATPLLLMRSQNESGSIFPETWCYANGSTWFISLETLIRPFMIFGSSVLARNLCSVAQVVLFLIGLIVLNKEVTKDKSVFLTGCITLIGMWGSAEHILYQGAYICILAWMFLQIGLLCKISSERKNGGVWFVLFGVLVCYRCVGGIREIGESVVPMIGAIVILCLLNLNKESVVFWIKRAIPIVIGTVVGFGVNKWVCITHVVNNSDKNSMMFNSNLNSIGDIIFIYLKNVLLDFGNKGDVSLFSVDGFRNLCSIFLCVMLVFVIPGLQIRRIKEESKEYQLFFIYSMLHSFVILVMVLFCGEQEARYVITVIVLSIAISCHYIKKYWIDTEFAGKYLCIFAFIGIMAIEAVGMVRDSSGWRDIYNAEIGFVNELREHNLSKGYGDYWGTYMLEAYSNGDLRTGAVAVTEDGIIPHKWLVDSKVFEPEDTNTFLMLDMDANGLICDRIDELFGKPIETFETRWCGYRPVMIYVFDHDIMADKGVLVVNSEEGN